MIVPCNCQVCQTPRADPDNCAANQRSKKHNEEVRILLPRCNETVKIVAGDLVYTCPKLLLSYYSTFFDKACYESGEGDVDKIDLAENVGPFKEFLSWIYTGNISSSEDELEHLWVSASRLGAPRFANEIMFRMFFEVGNGKELKVWNARWAYDIGGCGGSVTDNSKLREFTRDRIEHEGINRKFRLLQEEDKEVWISLFQTKKSLLRDFLTHNLPNTKSPGRFPQWNKYLLEAGEEKDPEVWRMDEAQLERVELPRGPSIKSEL